VKFYATTFLHHDDNYENLLKIHSGVVSTPFI